MDVTSISIRSPKTNEGIILNLNNPENDPFVLKGISGLAAEEILIFNKGVPEQDDPRSEEPSMMQSREIVALLAMNPRFSSGETFSDLRAVIYRLIASDWSSRVNVSVKREDGPELTIQGFISRVENSVSVKVPEVQVTIDCVEPVFKSPNYVSVLELESNIIEVLDPVSTANHGFVMEGVFTQSLPDGNGQPFTIRNADGKEIFSCLRGHTIAESPYFQEGDIVRLISEAGNKTILYRRDVYPVREEEFIAEKITAFSKWPQIFPGRNTLQFPEGFMVTEFKYKQAFWGV